MIMHIGFFYSEICLCCLYDAHSENLMKLFLNVKEMKDAKHKQNINNHGILHWKDV